MGKWHTTWEYRKWRKGRMAKNLMCEDCGDRVSEEVHHIVPLSGGGDLMTEENTQCLCKGCHDKITVLARRAYHKDYRHVDDEGNIVR